MNPGKACVVCGKEFTVERLAVLEKRKYCSQECSWAHQRGKKKIKFRHNQGKIARDGYIYIYWNDHVLPAHRVIFERHLGRSLIKGEVVHHRNGNKADNRLENLQLLTKANHSYGVETKHSEDICRLLRLLNQHGIKSTLT